VSRHSQRGASLPETAIVIGALLAFLFGIVDMARAVYTYSEVAELAREGARWAIVRGSQCKVIDNCNAGQSAIQTYLQGRSLGLTTASSIQVTAAWPGASCSPKNAPGCPVAITVTYPFSFMTGILPAGFNMSSTSQMVISD
jgi:Flp pilus assembly protein TadG